MVNPSTPFILVNIMAKLLSNDTASKVFRLISGKEMTQSSGVPRDLGAADADPLLYALRVVTRSAAKEVQVYAPDGMPLMYDRNYDYFADTSRTRDTKNDSWISLAGAVSPGSTVYAIFKSEEAHVEFSSTAPTEENGELPPYIVVGSTTETAPSSGKYTVEQSWLGSYAILQNPRIAPFSLKADGGDILMYYPANSLRVNGLDLSPSTTGLTESSDADWYIVTSYTTGLNLFVLMDDTDGYYGKPSTSEFGTDDPTYSGEIIKIPVLAVVEDKIVNVQLGGIIIDAVRPDGNKGDAIYKSLESASGGKFSGNNQTTQVRNFRDGTAPTGTLFDTTDNYSHQFAVRETDPDGNVDIRWVSDSVLASAVFSQVTQEWDIDDQLSDSFNDWYDSQADENKKFWERGEAAQINYGSEIGDSGKAPAIDLDSHILVSNWSVGGIISAEGANFGGKQLVFNEDGTVTWI